MLSTAVRWPGAMLHCTIASESISDFTTPVPDFRKCIRPSVDPMRSACVHILDMEKPAAVFRVFGAPCVRISRIGTHGGTSRADSVRRRWTRTTCRVLLMPHEGIAVAGRESRSSIICRRFGSSGLELSGSRRVQIDWPSINLHFLASIGALGCTGFTIASAQNHLLTIQRNNFLTALSQLHRFSPGFLSSLDGDPSRSKSPGMILSSRWYMWPFNGEAGKVIVFPQYALAILVYGMYAGMNRLATGR